MLDAEVSVRSMR